MDEPISKPTPKPSRRKIKLRQAFIITPHALGRLHNAMSSLGPTVYTARLADGTILSEMSLDQLLALANSKKARIKKVTAVAVSEKQDEELIPHVSHAAYINSVEHKAIVSMATEWMPFVTETISFEVQAAAEQTDALTKRLSDWGEEVKAPYSRWATMSIFLLLLPVIVGALATLVGVVWCSAVWGDETPAVELAVLPGTMFLATAMLYGATIALGQRYLWPLGIFTIGDGEQYSQLLGRRRSLWGGGFVAAVVSGLVVAALLALL